jgi:hypothetical protein
MMPERAEDEPEARRRTMSALLTKPIPAGFVLLIIYLLTSAALDSGGYLGADTGTKVATLEQMADDGTWRPVLPYWAEPWDRDGRHHPVYQSARNDAGEWVGVTTLPMLLAARPLYEVGGLRLALLLPMLGSVAAAYAALWLAKELGASTARWAVFWTVGLASPMFVYAIDFWEHSWGVACVLGAVAALVASLNGRNSVGLGLIAGSFLGLGATMRTEVLVYAVVAVGATCTVLLFRRTLGRAVGVGASAVVGFAPIWLGNAWLESALGARRRTERVAALAEGPTSAGFFDELGVRVEEGLHALVGPGSGGAAASIMVGAAVILVVLAAARAEARGDRRFMVVCLVLAPVPYALQLATLGLGFVSGALAAFPVAIAAVIGARTGSFRGLVAGVAVIALPIIWAVQWTGFAGPQWGGRFVLGSSLLLGVVGVLAVEGRRAVVPQYLIALSAAVTLSGVAWLVVRTHTVSSYFDQVVEADVDAIIALNPFLPREAGPVAMEHPFLAAEGIRDLPPAVDVARRSGAVRIAVIGWEGEPPTVEQLGGRARQVTVRPVDYFGDQTGIAEYVLE